MSTFENIIEWIKTEKFLRDAAAKNLHDLARVEKCGSYSLDVKLAASEDREGAIILSEFHATLDVRKRGSRAALFDYLRTKLKQEIAEHDKQIAVYRAKIKELA